MDELNINKILNRQVFEQKIVNFLKNFEENKSNISIPRGLYFFGNSGIGKTYFIKNILKKLNYDIVYFDGGDVRNKTIIDTITKCNTTDATVLDMFYRIRKPIVIVMDDIDSMNSGDKGGINALIKLIRAKKTKKQKLEPISNNPIICISNSYSDKKIKELMKVCECIELTNPSNDDMKNVITTLIPDVKLSLLPCIIYYIDSDLRKLNTILNMYKKGFLNEQILETISLNYSNNEDVKHLTCELLNNYKPIEIHNSTINETDRTIVGLLWHENIIDAFNNCQNNFAINFYVKILSNICFADYIDRITFQKQIWQFNEMSSLIKTFYNNKLYHDNFKSENKKVFKDIRFTKVLTKYSTEYNNSMFFQFLCQELSMDKKDMMSFFTELQHNDYEFDELFENYSITKLDVNRIFKFLDSISN